MNNQEPVFWTIYTKTSAGVEGQLFTFAKGPLDAWEKAEKYLADEHIKFLEECTEEDRLYFGPAPLLEVTGVIWKDTFIA